MTFSESSRAFIAYLERFTQQLAPLRWGELVASPERAAIFAVDLINGFCYEGNLASPRIAAVVPRAAQVCTQAHALGVRNFVLVQEWHHEQAEEFKAFAPHGIRHTREAQTVSALAALPFADQFTYIRKNSVNPAAETELDAWLDAHPLDVAIVVGDCTDICVYLTAMHLRTRANARNESMRVVVPADSVQTYDLPLETAQQVGALPHDGDFLHAVFLYHLALHKIEVVSAIET